MIYGVSLQRVQKPTNLQVRRLNAVTRKLLSSPKKIVYRAMVPNDEVDIHSDSGYRRLTGNAEDEENNTAYGEQAYLGAERR